MNVNAASSLPPVAGLPPPPPISPATTASPGTGVDQLSTGDAVAGAGAPVDPLAALAGRFAGGTSGEAPPSAGAVPSSAAAPLGGAATAGSVAPRFVVPPQVVNALASATRVLEGVNRFSMPVTAAVDAVRLGQSFAADGDRVGPQTARAAAGIAGAWTLGLTAAEAASLGGAAAGAALGALAGGIGAVPGAALGGEVGGLLGGLAGANGGAMLGTAIADQLNRDRQS